MTPTEDDLELTESAAQAFSDSVEARFVASLLEYLREHPRPWWNAEVLHDVWPTAERFRWYERRPDLRAAVTHELTGFASGAARASADDLQAELVERVLDAGDIDEETWEAAFDVRDLAVHGPRHEIWGAFRTRFPWEGPTAADRELLVWLFERMLVEEQDSSILTALYVRSAIDVRVWQDHVPLELRAQVDAHRLRRELEGAPFTCEDELAIVGLSKVVEHVPPAHLQRVLDALEHVLSGLVSDEEEEEAPPELEALPPDYDLPSLEDLPSLDDHAFVELESVDDEGDESTVLEKNAG